MSVMRIAYGAPDPAAKSQKIMLGVGIGLALVAHGAILALVMQARGARMIWEPDPPAISVDFAPRYAPPPPPPPRAQASVAHPDTKTPPPQKAAVETRDTPLNTPTDSQLTANPHGTADPTTGTETKIEPPANPPQTPAKPDPLVHNAEWARHPTASDMAKFYPDRAQRLNMEGQTVISCLVSVDGQAQNCRVVRETPADYGFGEAALRLARSFRFKPMTVDGQAKPGGAIQIPLAWKLQ